MIETYTIEQLYERLIEARRTYNGSPSTLRWHYLLKADSDYQRALIVEARHKQGEY